MSLVTTFPYKIIRSRRKTLVIQVNDGEVVIRSPLRTPETVIFDFIREKTPWVDKHLTKQRKQQKETLVIAEGKQAPFFGIPRTIQVQQGRSRTEIDDNHIYLYAPSCESDKLSAVYQKWLQQQAREYMATRTISMARELGVEEKLNEVIFRKTRTKWGHCTHDGIIQYNWLAMMAPREVVDYLVAHETSHLKHLNHSKRFWTTVEKLCPNYIEHRYWLRDNGHRIWL